MSTATQTAATIDDLRMVEGKAELIGGRIVPIRPTGFRPGLVGGRIYRGLDDHCGQTGRGVALPDNVGFVVPELSSGRESFAPDASYYHGPFPADEMDFVEGPPTFAVEVGSKGDYGPAAERDSAAERADYFEAGTIVVWDVDPKARLIRSYPSTSPDQPRTFGWGDLADAEPAVPGWCVLVDTLFAS